MINAIVEKVKGFLMKPVETFQQSRTDEPGAILTYFTVLLLINAIFSALVSVMTIGKMTTFPGMDLGIPLPVLEFFAVFVAGLILTPIFAAWVHLWVYLFGGRKGIMQTLKVAVYGQTPRLLLGWIPFIGFIFTLWSLFLFVLGIRELQELSPMKAVLVVAIAVLIPVILIIMAFAYFVIASPGMVVPSDVGAFPAGI
jgi:hypothetical protein